MQNTRVRKLFSTILGVGAVAGSLVLTSCEDEFTEADAIKAQQETLTALRNQEDSLNRIGARINYTVTVTTAGQGSTSSRTSADASAEGATVTVTQAGETYTETAGKGGVATFKGLLYGKATVTVETEGHTAVTYTTTLGTDDDYYKVDNSVGTLIPVFPLTVEAGASMVSGKAWAELDATNDAPEAAVGAKVRATISVNTVLNTYGRGSGYGRIENATYDGFVQTDTVDANGNYSLIIPNGNGADGQGFTPKVEFLPFVAKQKYVAMEDGKLMAMEKDVLFGGQTSTDHIKSNLSNVYAEIEAPTAEAKDFAVKAELVAQMVYTNDIDFGQNTGSGYEEGDTFELSADKDGKVVIMSVATVGGNGEITSISFSENGDYTTAPTITPKTVKGTNAAFTIDFTNKYNVVIENAGSDYWVRPEVNMVYTNELTGREVVGSAFSSLLVPEDGQVGEKGQVIRTLPSATKPTFTVVNPVAKQATVKSVNVSEDGTISSVTLDEKGAGYLTSPKITFKNVSGEEVSAAGVAVMDGIGRIEVVGITNPGSGFSQYANDTDHAETLAEMNLQEEQQPTSQTFKPGTTNTGVNFIYGTGAVQ